MYVAVREPVRSKIDDFAYLRVLSEYVAVVDTCEDELTI